jgi:glycosyltransferase involved in cell wall biosynthesis
MKKFQYIANIRLPTEKAHGAQIMKTCEALAEAGAQVELLVPARHTHIKESAFAYYAVKENFSVTYLPVLDLIWLGRVGFWLESLSFSFFVLINTLGARGVLYSRDELPLFLLSFFQDNTVWESHTGRSNFLTRRLLRKGSKLVVISEGLKRFYSDKNKDLQILVAPDAIDLAAFLHPQSKGAARTRLGLPQDKKVALYIGRLDGWKGVSTLFDAAKHLPQDILVAVIGGEESELQKFRRDYPEIVFLGARPYRELADNQAAADVLVLPNTGKDNISAQFTSPMKLFSYMAAGRPIVASDLPSLREVLSEENAVFFEPDNAVSLAGAIMKVCGDPNLARRVADTARTDVARYTWSVRAQSILTFLTT